VHRCGMGANAAAIADGYRTVPDAARATGGRMPYALVVGADGTIEQSALLTDVTPHVRSWNPVAIGVGVVGDFRAAGPQVSQYDALVWLCARLALLVGGVTRVKGHDELDGATSWVGKRCPGEYLPMRQLRADVRDAIPSVSTVDWGIRV